MSLRVVSGPVSNVPFEKLHWTIARAAAEFEVNTERLEEQLERLGFVPDPETGCYYTIDILRAIHPDQATLKEALLEEQIRSLKLENNAIEGILLDSNQLRKGFDMWLTAAVQVIKTFDIPIENQNNLIECLAQCSKVFDEVALKQAK